MWDSELRAVHVVAFERPHEGLGQAIALRAVRWRRDRDQAQLVGVEDTGCRRVLERVVAEPLKRVQCREYWTLAEMGPAMSAVEAWRQHEPDDS